MNNDGIFDEKTGEGVNGGVIDEVDYVLNDRYDHFGG